MTMKHQPTAPTHVVQRADADVRRLRQDEPGAQPIAERPVPPRLLRFPAIRDRTGLSRSTIWRLERCGEFPKHRRLSANTVAWVEEEVDIWIRQRVGEPAG